MKILNISRFPDDSFVPKAKIELLIDIIELKELSNKETSKELIGLLKNAYNECVKIEQDKFTNEVKEHLNE